MLSVNGPFRSVRLGTVLSVGPAPWGSCNYRCGICHLALAHRCRREACELPADVARSAGAALDRARRDGTPIDHVVIGGSGEPTLDVNLGATITALRALGAPVAVVSNGALLSRDDVRRELGLAEWVSLKIDAGRESTWRRLHRPHPSLRFELLVQGLRVFAAEFGGELHTETRLVDGVNTSLADLEATADVVSSLRPHTAWLEPHSGAQPTQQLLERASTLFGERARRARVWRPHLDVGPGLAVARRRKNEEPRLAQPAHPRYVDG